MKRCVIEYTDEGITTNYEIQYEPANWGLIKWLSLNAAQFEHKDEIDLQKFYTESDTVINECFKGWRIEGEGEYRNDYNVLPPRVVLAFMAHVSRLIGAEVNVRVRTEKN